MIRRLLVLAFVLGLVYAPVAQAQMEMGGGGPSITIRPQGHPTPDSSETLTVGLVHYWPMEQATDADAPDMVVGGTTLSYTGTAHVTSVAGKYRAGVQTLCANSGAGGVLMYATMPTAGARTWSSWQSFTDAATWSLTPSTVFGFVNGTHAKLTRDGLKFALTNGNTILAEGADLSTGTFYHSVQTFDGTDKYVLYVNGEVYAAATLTATSTAAYFLVGPWAGTDSPGTQIVDEVGQWGRVLTDDEIRALYNGGQGRFFDGSVFK